MNSDISMKRTSSFLFAQPSSSAGSSIPFIRAIARSAPAGSSNSAKPKPCGLFAGVIRRLNDFMGPHAFREVSIHVAMANALQTYRQ